MGVKRVFFAVLAICVLGLVFNAASSLAGSTFTWSGTDSLSADWSVGDNWGGGTAPLASDSGDSLVFPADLTGGDCATTQTDACYTSQDNLSGYTISGMTIDDGVGYGLSVGDPLTIGSIGISATTSSGSFEPAEIDTPITLGAAQTWSIDGGTSGLGELVSTGGISGNTYALNVALSRVGYLDLAAGSNNEVGAVTVTGSDSGDTGLNAYDNGALELEGGAKLNESDANLTQLTDAALYGEGITGPVTSTGGVVTAGDPLGTLNVDGALTLDFSSALQFAIGAGGTTPGTDYSQITAVGNVSLSDAELDITGTDDNNDCPSLVFGSTYTLISTSGSIIGSFGNGTNNEDVTMDCTGARAPVLEISYTTHTVTATVVGPLASTTTTLSGSPWPPYEYTALTLTATVTASFGTPSGTVSIIIPNSSGLFVGIPVCQAPVTLVGSTYEASCTASPTASPGGPFGAPGAPGSTVVYRAAFTPASGTALSPSQSNELAATVAASPTPILGTLSSGTATTKGSVLTLSLGCANTIDPTATCPATVSLSVTETLKGGKVIAVTSGAKRKPKSVKRTISVGGDDVTVSAGPDESVSIPLNGIGKSLLKSHHTLHASLTVTSNGQTVATQTITFKTKTKKKNKR